MRNAINAVLKAIGVDCDAVASGEEGMAKLHEKHYDLVFLDLVLHTGHNGIEILRILQISYKDLLVVLMTASASEEPIFQEASRSVEFILRKPFKLDQIKRIIEEAKNKTQGNGQK